MRMKILMSVALLAALLLSALPSAMAEKVDGTVSVQSKSFALGIGWSWGDGTLKYKGKTHTFSVDGLSVVDAGYSSMSAVGEVYHLKDINDFNGTYTAAEAGVAVGGGGAGLTMKNQNGVVINLEATQQGVKLTFGPKGMNIKLK